MLRNYYINREFIVSAKARSVYRASAWLSIGLFFGVLAIKIAGPLRADPSTVRLLLQVGTLGAAITLVAMEYYFFAFDKSPLTKKVFWFCMMAFLPFLGAGLYCLLSYSKGASASAPLADRAE